MNYEDTKIEFSRKFNLDLIKKSGSEVVIKATEQECDDLAKRFSIPKVVFLKAICVLTRLKQREVGDYKLIVNMSAEIIQQCVVTLHDVPEVINEVFSIIFIIDTNDENPEASKIIDFDMNEEDIEIIKNSEVDLGELVAEYLSLSMNSYPRKQDAKETDLGYKILGESEVSISEEKKNPFNVLESLKH